MEDVGIASVSNSECAAFEDAASSRTPHLEYWKDIAQIRSEIGGLAMSNYRRVNEMRAGLYSNELSDDELIELGLSYGATNDMEGGQADLEQLFACLYTDSRVDDMARMPRSDRAWAIYEMMQRAPIDLKQPSSKLFMAAQFLHEAGEIEPDEELGDLLVYGALDVYERIWKSDSIDWDEKYKREALVQWHGGMSVLLSRDIANPGLSASGREEAEECFVDLQKETIERIRTIARLKHDKDPGNNGYVVRNGEMFEVFTQISGWYLIREQGLFGEYEIRPSKEREDRPRDGIVNKQTSKYAHDAVVVRNESGEQQQTRIQLKACPKEQDWESSYVDEIPVVRVKNISEDKLRKKIMRSMNDIHGHYRSPKKRSRRQLHANVEGFFSEELFRVAA